MHHASSIATLSSDEFRTLLEIIRNSIKNVKFKCRIRGQVWSLNLNSTVEFGQIWPNLVKFAIKMTKNWPKTVDLSLKFAKKNGPEWSNLVEFSRI